MWVLCVCVVVVSFVVAFAVCLSVCLYSRVTLSYLGPDKIGLLGCEVARCLQGLRVTVGFLMSYGMSVTRVLSNFLS